MRGNGPFSSILVVADNVSTDKAKISVFGAGSWGMTLAWLLGNAGNEVCLYTREKSKAEKLNADRTVTSPVHVVLPELVKVTSDINEAVRGDRLLLLCSTSQTMRELATNLARALQEEKDSRREPAVVVSAVKGLELNTLKRMSEVIAECLDDVSICTLSGPNLADEILEGRPAATVVSSRSEAVASSVQAILRTNKFRVYTNTDIVGTELGGAVKNIIAIAAGVSDGLNLGANAKAALLTRGLAEMTRLAEAMGGKSSTMAGLAGMGDLFATCASVTSRNYRMGQALASGVTAQQAEEELGVVAEGVKTTFAVCELAKRLNLELPIALSVHSMLSGKTTPEGAIMTLMTRPPVSEARRFDPPAGQSVNSGTGN